MAEGYGREKADLEGVVVFDHLTADLLDDLEQIAYLKVTGTAQAESQRGLGPVQVEDVLLQVRA